MGAYRPRSGPPTFQVRKRGVVTATGYLKLHHGVEDVFHRLAEARANLSAGERPGLLLDGFHCSIEIGSRGGAVSRGGRGSRQLVQRGVEPRRKSAVRFLWLVHLHNGVEYHPRQRWILVAQELGAHELDVRANALASTEPGRDAVGPPVRFRQRLTSRAPARH